MAILIVLVVVLALAVIFGLWVAGVYNGLVRLRNLVQEAWRQIDVELGRRHDLIPNLVETVRAYATHERQALDSVVAARTAARGAVGSVEQQAIAEGTLSAALGGLFAVAEAYPDLRANQNFLALQAELTETEDRVAAGRRFYNANVRELNTRVESFPSNLFASAFGFTRAQYFEVVDLGQREVPHIRLASPPAAPVSAVDPLRAVPPAPPAGGAYSGGAYSGGAYPGGDYAGGAYPGGAYPGGDYSGGEYTVPGSPQYGSPGYGSAPNGQQPQLPYGNPPQQ